MTALQRKLDRLDQPAYGGDKHGGKHGGKQSRAGKAGRSSSAKLLGTADGGWSGVRYASKDWTGRVAPAIEDDEDGGEDLNGLPPPMLTGEWVAAKAACYRVPSHVSWLQVRAFVGTNSRRCAHTELSTELEVLLPDDDGDDDDGDDDDGDDAVFAVPCCAGAGSCGPERWSVQRRRPSVRPG